MASVAPLARALGVVARRLDITPTAPVTLGCSPAGDTPVSRVAEPLEADVIALQSPAGPVVILSLDTLYPVEEARTAILAAAPRLPSDRLLIAGSHTHQAPMLIRDKPGLGRVDAAYATWLHGALAAEVCAALADLERVSGGTVWSLATTVAEHAINRRLPTKRGIRQAPNWKGSTDEAVSVVVIRSDDRPVAILWNYACHPVGHPEELSVSAHFPHVVREGLRRHFGMPDLPVVYLQGFSGDVRPNCSTRITKVRGVARLLKHGRSFHEISPRAYTRWSASLSRLVVEATSQARGLTPVPVTTAETRVDLDRFVQGAALDGTVRFQYLGLGAELGIVAVSAELVSPYAAWARDHATGVAHLLPVGCTDAAFGYIPTTEIIREGGYEAGEFCRAFGYRSVRPNVEEITKAALVEVLPTADSPPAAATVSSP